MPRPLLPAVIVLLAAGCLSPGDGGEGANTLADGAPGSQTLTWKADPGREIHELWADWSPEDSTGALLVRASQREMDLVWAGFELDLAHNAAGPDVVHARAGPYDVGVDGLSVDGSQIRGQRAVDVVEPSSFVLCWGKGIRNVTLSVSSASAPVAQTLPSEGWALRDLEGPSARAIRVQAAPQGELAIEGSSPALVSLVAFTGDGSWGTIEIETASDRHTIELRNETTPDASIVRHHALLYTSEPVIVRARVAGDASDTKIFVNRCALPATITSDLGEGEIWIYSAKPLSPNAS